MTNFTSFYPGLSRVCYYYNQTARSTKTLASAVATVALAALAGASWPMALVAGAATAAAVYKLSPLTKKEITEKTLEEWCQQAFIPTGNFPTMEAAIDFWFTGAAQKPVLTDCDEEKMCQFLSRLTETAEYKNPHTKQHLMQRVMNALTLMANNSSIREAAFDIIEEGLSSCDDTIIRALGLIELKIQLETLQTSQLIFRRRWIQLIASQYT